MKFKLLDFIKGDVVKTCIVSNSKGTGYMNAVYTFNPGKVYETNDPIFAAYIKNEGVGDVRSKSPYNPELKEVLESRGIPYETRKCGTCAGSKPSIYYNPFEIVNEEDEDENA